MFFFGGVNPVKFLPSDQMRWFDEIIRADELALEQKLLALPTVNKDWKVSSNTMNLSCAWLIYAIHVSKALTPQQKHQGMMDVLLILQYKFFTSLLFHYFRYPAKPEVAEATYAALSDKFTIKQVGTWGALFKDRAETILAKDSPHMKNGTLLNFDDDEGAQETQDAEQLDAVVDVCGQQFLVGSGGWLQDESCLDLQEESRTGQQLKAD